MPKTWTKQQEAHLRKLFKEKTAPFELKSGKKRISPSVIKQIFDDNPIFQNNYSLKNFYPLYRRKAAEFLCNQTKTGARRKFLVNFRLLFVLC